MAQPKQIGGRQPNQSRQTFTTYKMHRQSFRLVKYEPNKNTEGEPSYHHIMPCRGSDLLDARFENQGLHTFALGLELGLRSRSEVAS